MRALMNPESRKDNDIEEKVILLCLCCGKNLFAILAKSSRVVKKQILKGNKNYDKRKVKTKNFCLTRKLLPTSSCRRVGTRPQHLPSDSGPDRDHSQHPMPAKSNHDLRRQIWGQKDPELMAEASINELEAIERQIHDNEVISNYRPCDRTPTG